MQIAILGPNIFLYQVSVPNWWNMDYILRYNGVYSFKLLSQCGRKGLQLQIERWKQYVSLKYCKPPTRPYTIIILIAFFKLCNDVCWRITIGWTELNDKYLLVMFSVPITEIWSHLCYISRLISYPRFFELH